MILDNQALFSDEQAITDASAASTNYIDLTNREIAFGTPVPLFIQVVEAFVGCTSVAFSVQTDNETTFSAPVTLASTDAIAVADLVAGYSPPLKFIPAGNLDYIRLYYTIVGTASKGKITAGIAFGGSHEGHHNIPEAIVGS